MTCLRRKVGNIEGEWFQQDGATPHAALATLVKLQDVFRERLISRRTDHPWAAHSPDLNPLDFFLWGFLKNRVYENTPETLEELKAEIRRVIRDVNVDTCGKAIKNSQRQEVTEDTAAITTITQQIAIAIQRGNAACVRGTFI